MAAAAEGVRAVPKVWPEFDPSICERLNSEKCLVIASTSADTAAAVASAVDDILATAAFAAKEKGEEPALPTLARMAKLMRVQFTTAEHVDMLQNCIAVHGRIPMLALVDMTNDDDGFSYVLDIAPTHTPGASASLPAAPISASGDGNYKNTGSSSKGGNCGLRALVRHRGEEEGTSTEEVHYSDSGESTDGAADAITIVADQALPRNAMRVTTAVAAGTGTVSKDALRAFLTRVAQGVEPRASQGAPPTVADLVPPGHGVVLSEARCATTSSWHRLLRCAIANENGGALVVFWSDRCPCCPGVLHLLDALVGTMRALARGLACACGCVSQAAGAGEREATATVSLPHMLFPYLVCNIDENDYPPEDWAPRNAGAATGAASCHPGMPVEQQCVPCIVGYTHSGALQRVPFKQSRTSTNLVRFLLDTCVSPTLGTADFRRRFEEAAVAMAADVDTDALMDAFDEKDAAYESAIALQASLKPHDSPATVADVVAKINGIRSTHLRQCCARRKCATVEEVVKRLLQRGSGTAGGCQAALPSVCSSVAAAAGKGSSPQDCCLVMGVPRLRSGASSPGPFPEATMAAGEKRQREDAIDEGVRP